MPKSLLNKISY